MNTRLNIAHKFFNDQLFANAKELYQEIYSCEHDIESLFGLALCAHQESDYIKTLTYINRVLEENINYAGAYNLAGIISLEIGDLDSAKTLFISAIEKDPSFIDAQRNYAEVLIAQEDFQNGLASLKTILDNHPEDVLTLLRVAQYYLDIGKLDEASRYAQKTLELEPSNDAARELLHGMENGQPISA